MTNEEKQLLLKDICARLQSSLICKVIHKDSEGWKEDDMVLRSIEDDEGYFTTENGSAYSCDFKPYLRPMSSMTDEDWNIFDSLAREPMQTELFDWLNERYFDYRGLIEKGLALEAPEGMYKTE